MSKYSRLTKYIDLLANENFGEWFIDKENDGTMEHPFQMPYVNYSRVVDDFIDDVYECCEEYGVHDYIQILKAHNIDWGKKSMTNADVTELTEEAILALLLGAIRAERFCDGALLAFLKNVSIKKWLLALTEK